MSKTDQHRTAMLNILVAQTARDVQRLVRSEFDWAAANFSDNPSAKHWFELEGAMYAYQWTMQQPDGTLSKLRSEFSHNSDLIAEVMIRSDAWRKAND